MINSPLEQFEIVSLIPFGIGSFNLSFTNSSLMMLLSVTLIVMLVQLIAVDGNGYLVPSRWQTFVESVVKLLVQMVGETVGPKGGQFLAFVFTLFTFTLVNNSGRSSSI